jgi:hypothetical protein
MATSRNSKIPLARVQRWNAQIVYVQCPFCTKIHTHGFGDGYSRSTRAAHCNYHPSLSFPPYRFDYPFSKREGVVGYEIDKSNGFYVALGAKAFESKVECLEKALDELNLGAARSPPSKKWEQATEMITIGMEDERLRRLQQYFGGEDTFTLRRLDHVVSRMLAFGDVEYVGDYLDTSSEAETFLLGGNEEGKSALSLAACERYPAIVKLLLDHGANPDHQDKDGRTPLMEASLWGRIENVNFLLEHGANRELRDLHGHQAIDLAESCQDNDEERYQRSGGDKQVYREDIFMANQARRLIVELLKEPEEGLDTIPTSAQTFAAHTFKKTDRGTIELIAEFHIPRDSKTIATLHRPSNFPFIAAMSGWGHGETNVTVLGKDWTAEVMKISSIVGHRLAVDEQNDQGIKGRYYASHAEKQLIAYFISKHFLIKSEDDELLRKAKPPVVLEKATILVSRPLCGDCLQFVQAVLTAFGLCLPVLDCSEK